MEFQLNKKTEFPIYQQLKEQIKYFLLNGDLQPGTKLPPPKDLAGYLRINKNTVIVAYKELEKEGVIVTRHGQGTYVSEDLPPDPGFKRKQALIELAREALERARELGFGAEDLFTVVFSQTVLGLGYTQPVRVLFVECNSVDVGFYVPALEKEIRMPVEGCLLADLADRMDDKAAPEVDVVVTTFFHVEDVKAICEPMEKKVIAIMAAPEMSVILRLGQLPPGTKLGFVCGTEWSTEAMRGSLGAAGIRHIDYECIPYDDREALDRMLARVDIVAGCRSVVDEVRKLVPEGLTVMEFGNVLEQGGVELLRKFLAERD
ncbi:GntR family transcriptional regulator [Anaeroselena agilis]|uniref:GntR family transcriptional regulator n=1 Tax=Anaeroselena agilis TaxID=3063788 RepID=A0ABU3NVG9_9FIRM|nr:GntR family transcriptional regulator [Selenomonadales bacterium 4137-cl]